MSTNTEKTVEHEVKSIALLESLGKCEQWMLKSIRDPKFEKKGRVHDWRNHVPERLRLIWFDLSDDARLAIIVVAEEGAYKEEWD